VPPTVPKVVLLPADDVTPIDKQSMIPATFHDRCRHSLETYLIIIIIIIYLLKSTEQEDAHMIRSRTRKAQKTGAYILPIKKQKKQTPRLRFIRLEGPSHRFHEYTALCYGSLQCVLYVMPSLNPLSE